MKACFFDMDGTLIKETSWRVAHNHFDVDNSENVKAFEEGKISSWELMRRDFNLWDEPTTSDLENAVCHLEPRKNNDQLIEAMRDEGYGRIVIITGGIKIVAEKIFHLLHLDDFLANGFKTKEQDEKEFLVEPEYKYNFSKKSELVNKLIADWEVPIEKTLAVGDSRFDADMLKTVDKGIAFNPKDNEVKKAADKVIEDDDITKVIQYI